MGGDVPRSHKGEATSGLMSEQNYQLSAMPHGVTKLCFQHVFTAIYNRGVGGGAPVCGRFPEKAMNPQQALTTFGSVIFASHSPIIHHQKVGKARWLRWGPHSGWIQEARFN